MFVAMSKNGTYVSLLEETVRSQIAELRKNETFHCIVCKEPVLIRMGEKRISHFAHMKGSQCSQGIESESEYHLEGKRQLYMWLKKQPALQVEIEPYLKEIRQRPDLLVNAHGKLYAIEYQCSSIEADLFTKRTKSYKRLGIYPLWILGAKHLQRKSSQLFRVSAFQWLFLHHRLDYKLPVIFYFCPLKNQLFALTNLQPISATNVYGHLSFHSLTNLSFLDMWPTTTPDFFQYKEQMYLKRKKERYTFSNYPSPAKKRLLHTLYAHRISPSLFPAEAGLPVPSMFWNSTPPTQWQLWILVDSIIKTSVGAEVSFQHVYQNVLKRMKKKEVVIRQLPLVENTHFSFPIMEYLRLLTKLGVLRMKGKNVFVKQTEIKIPKTWEEALTFDKIVTEKIFTKSFWKS